MVPLRLGALVVLLSLLHADAQEDGALMGKQVSYAGPSIVSGKESDCGSLTMGAEVGALGADELEEAMNAAEDSAVVPTERLYPHDHLVAAQQIPYAPAETTVAAQRRPCNLDEAITTVRAVVSDSEEESTRDATFTSTVFNASIAAAAAAVEAAESAVDALERARVANSTIYAHLAVLDAKAKLMHEKMSIKARLMETEGTIKLPLVEALGKIHVEEASTLLNKQAAMEDFAKPNKTEYDNKRTIDLYNKLLTNLKQQEAAQLNQTHELLTQIQLEMDQIDVDMDRLRVDVDAVQAQVQKLLPVALVYSPPTMQAARTIMADAKAHYSSLLNTYKDNVEAHAKRESYRSSAKEMLEGLNTTVTVLLVPKEFHGVGADDAMGPEEGEEDEEEEDEKGAAKKSAFTTPK